MAIAYDYTVQINGCDFDFDEECWYDEHYTVKEVVFDTLEEAQEFVRGITAKQALEWERETKCNGLDVVIWKDELNGNQLGWHYGDSIVVGEREFIGDKENGTWL